MGVESLVKDLKSKRWEDLKIFRELGIGRFGSAYLCMVKGITGSFVVKVLVTPDTLEDCVLEKSAIQGKLLSTESVEIPYHPYVSGTFSSFFMVCDVRNSSDKNPLEKLPKYEEHWKSEVEESFLDEIRVGVVIMPFCYKNLNYYVCQRMKANETLSYLEMCYILKCLLEGVNHLHKNYIVHRDLHPENVFVDERYGRAYIADFGCCLNLRTNGGKFEIEKDDERLFSLTFLSGKKKIIRGSCNLGGCSEYLSPELTESSLLTAKNIVNFEMNDLFSVGVIGYQLMKCFEKEYNCGDSDEEVEMFDFAPFKPNKMVKNCKGEDIIVRTDDDYIELDLNDHDLSVQGPKALHSDLSKILRELLRTKPEDRMKHKDSIIEITRIIEEKEGPVNRDVSFISDERFTDKVETKIEEQKNEVVGDLGDFIRKFNLKHGISGTDDAVKMKLVKYKIDPLTGEEIEEEEEEFEFF